MHVIWLRSHLLIHMQAFLPPLREIVVVTYALRGSNKALLV